MVWSQAIVGNTVYAGGSFQNARPAGAAPGTNLVPRTHLLAFDITTGAADHVVRPAAQRSGPGRRRLAGRLTDLRHRRLHDRRRPGRASGSPPSTPRPGSSSPPSRRKGPSSQGRALAVTNDTVYVGGAFAGIRHDGPRQPARRAGVRRCAARLGSERRLHGARRSRSPRTARRSSPADRSRTSAVKRRTASPRSTPRPAPCCRGTRPLEVRNAGIERRRHEPPRRQRQRVRHDLPLRRRRQPRGTVLGVRRHRRPRLGGGLPRRHLQLGRVERCRCTSSATRTTAATSAVASRSRATWTYQRALAFTADATGTNLHEPLRLPEGLVRQAEPVDRPLAADPDAGHVHGSEPGARGASSPPTTTSSSAASSPR